MPRMRSAPRGKPLSSRDRRVVFVDRAMLAMDRDERGDFADDERGHGDADLGPPTVTQALIFTVVFYITMATSGLLLLIALFTVRHRTLHDLASDLVVVRRGAFATWCRQTGAGWL